MVPLAGNAAFLSIRLSIREYFGFFIIDEGHVLCPAGRIDNRSQCTICIKMNRRGSPANDS
jgi:hypothetical protein